MRSASERKMTPEIVWLAQNGKVTEFKAYLEKHPNEINLQDDAGLTALHWGAGHRNLAICEAALGIENIDLFIKDCRQRKAIDHAIDGGHQKIIRTLMARMYDLD